MKQLIVTADDFGASAEINEAVIRAHSEGILTSASLMVNEPAFGQAVELARKTPRLAVGLHLALSLSRATLPPEQIPDLVDAEGKLSDNSTKAGWKYYFSKRVQEQLEKEIRAQAEKFLATGLPLDHINGHQHIHMHPRVFRMIARLAEEYKVPGIRIVRDKLRLNLKLDKKRWAYKLSHWIIFSNLGRRCRKLAKDAPWVSADYVMGLYQDGRLNREHLLGLLQSLPEGIVEIYCHPATKNAGVPSRAPEQEFAALIDPAVKKLVESGGIQLTCYRQLRSAPRRA
jgi:hopanoid biosynthesis associated protein HpnK